MRTVAAVLGACAAVTDCVVVVDHDTADTADTDASDSEEVDELLVLVDMKDDAELDAGTGLYACIGL